jgi:hypothetical protein
MSLSICVRCGQRKPGAFAPCPACKYDPAADPDRRSQARSLWLSDRHLKPEALETISTQLKAGEPVAWDERALDALIVELQTQQSALHVGKRAIGCSVFLWSVVAIVVALVAAAIVLATWRE